MKKSLMLQILILSTTALVAGVLNNLRPSTALQWVQNWTPLSQLSPQNETVVNPVAESDEWDFLETEALVSAIENFIRNPSSTTDESSGGFFLINLNRARKIYEYAKHLTLWIDARSPELYAEGHIEGAQLLHFYEKNKYLPDLQKRIEAENPVALIIYCKGKECYDSRLLAEELSLLGYQNIFIYTGGYDLWVQQGYEVERTQERANSTSTIPTERPKGMYLEHLLLDLIPFALGVFFLLFWKKIQSSIWANRVAISAVSLFFIYAAFPKVLQPILFAKAIWNYDIVPGNWINLLALYLPMFELLIALGFISRIFRQGSGVLIGLLLLLYMGLVSFNVWRGLEFHCGCISETLYISNLYLEGWNDKLTLMLRDFGLFVLTIFVLYRTLILEKETTLQPV